MIIKRFKIFESEIELKGTEPDWLIDQLIQIDIRHIDFNRKRQKGTITKNIVEIFEKYGFKWGGNWKNPYYQHFHKSI